MGAGRGTARGGARRAQQGERESRETKRDDRRRKRRDDDARRLAQSPSKWTRDEARRDGGLARWGSRSESTTRRTEVLRRARRVCCAQRSGAIRRARATSFARATAPLRLSLPPTLPANTHSCRYKNVHSTARGAVRNGKKKEWKKEKEGGGKRRGDPAHAHAHVHGMWVVGGRGRARVDSAARPGTLCDRSMSTRARSQRDRPFPRAL